MYVYMYPQTNDLNGGNDEWPLDLIVINLVVARGVQLKTGFDQQRAGFTGQRGLLEGTSKIWDICFLADLDPSAENVYNSESTRDTSKVMK